jgi:hypothetical protein
MKPPKRIRSVGVEFFHADGRTEGERERRSEANYNFCSFAKSTENTK